tara:strand:- start:1016 stop:2215 length:1200 start_codon:yes stop_codon:yes gene_type:complete
MGEKRHQALWEEFEAEPFFLPIGDTNLNACLGKQGSERSYYRGYIRSAILLVEDVLNNERFADFDSVVLPILFNARHGVELNLKFILNTFNEWGLKVPQHKITHDISALYDCISKVKMGDQELKSIVIKIGPYVRSLSNIDHDGEELRYHKTRDNVKSLDTISIVNLEVVRFSLAQLNDLTEQLHRCLRRLSLERKVVSHTSVLSRRDLLEIAGRLPDRTEWASPRFKESKKKVMDDYDLSGTQFSRALKVIETNRAMMPLIGLDCHLLSLTDFQIQKILRLRPNTFEQKVNLQSVLENNNSKNQAQTFHKYIRTHLSVNDRADLMTIYFIGRDGDLAEYYEYDFAEKCRAIKSKSIDDTSYLFSTIFMESIVEGLRILGKAALATQVESKYTASATHP